MRHLELDLSKFSKDLSRAGKTIGKGVKTGMHDVLDDWKREATDLAPLSESGGTLRKSITTELSIGGDTFEGVITANATEKSKNYGRFNYAYYIHEIGGEIKNPTTPGTIDKFIDKPADENEDRWLKLVEQEIEKQLRRDGW
jgi:hypothetical protein